MSREVPLLKIYWDDADLREVGEAIKAGMYWAIGPQVEAFESGLARYIGSTHAVVFSSGTTALHALLLAYGIGGDDEVIVPSFTFIATANAALFVGAKPVFADIEETTLGLDPHDVERRITAKTKAILPIHYGGCPCLIEDLREIAHDRGLLLLEDAAEAFGAQVAGGKTGTFGQAGVLSFCQNKIITTGEGGAVITDSQEIADRLRLLRSHGRSEKVPGVCSSEQGDHVDLGFNFRMSNITAALGKAQLEKADQAIARRRERAFALNQRLSGVKQIRVPEAPDGYFHVYQMYTVRVQGGRSQRDGLMDYLGKRGVASKLYFPPVHLSQLYRRRFGCSEGDLPVTERLACEAVTLPMYPTLSTEDIDYIAEQVRDYFS